MNDETERLIARYLDGTASPAEGEQLDRLLRRDPGARRSLFLASEQGDALREFLGEDRNAALAHAAATGGSPRRTWLFSLSAAVVIVLVGAALLRFPRPAPVETAPEVVTLPSPRVEPVTPKAPIAPAPGVPAPEPVPAPAPVPLPAPAPPEAPMPQPSTEPRPAPAPAPSTVRETVAVAAVVEKAGGDVRIVSAGQSVPATAGQKLLSGQSLETAGRGRAALHLTHGVTLEIGPDTLVTRIVGAEVTLAKGFVRADVAATRPLVVATARARAEVGGARFSFRSGADATWVEVDRGRGRLQRTEDGASIEISAGQVGAVGAGLPFVPRGQDVAVDQARVDAAIQKGVEFLRTGQLPAAVKKSSDELILLTLLHAGVTESDPQFRKLLASMLEGPLDKTYNVSLQAMVLEELDRVKHQGRLQQCAQFLVDNQCKNGQWSYGTPTIFVNDLPVPSEAPRDVRTGVGADRVRDFSAPKEKPKVTRRLPVKKMREGSATGDNSNSQYAALGLRACFDAGIDLPRDVVQSAKEWWIKCQGPEEAPGSGYEGVRGWGYHKPGKKDDDDDDKNGVLGSMTAGGVGSLVICDYLLGLDGKKNLQARAGLNWLAAHFTVSDNPGGKPWRQYYFLYGMERAGVLSGTEKFGAHAWYPLGARYLLDEQNPNGSWKLDQQARTNPVWDTCFSILFLKRATKPLVASEDRKMRK